MNGICYSTKKIILCLYQTKVLIRFALLRLFIGENQKVPLNRYGPLILLVDFLNRKPIENKIIEQVKNAIRP